MIIGQKLLWSRALNYYDIVYVIIMHADSDNETSPGITVIAYVRTIKKFNSISSVEFTEKGHNIYVVVNIVEQR